MRTQRENALRQEILACIKANGIDLPGEAWLSLAFMTESQLVQLARELRIIIKKEVSA
jgi:hypothetical protein